MLTSSAGQSLADLLPYFSFFFYFSVFNFCDFILLHTLSHVCSRPQVIGLTRVASRVTMIFGGCTLIAFGVVTKLGAILSAIPDPLVGVVLSTSMAMVGTGLFAFLNISFAGGRRCRRKCAVRGLAFDAQHCHPRLLNHDGNGKPFE
jgi:hypothetical protein